MKFKRLMILVLVVCLAFLAISCGKTDDKTTSEDKNDAVITLEPTPEEIVLDLKGRAVKMSQWWDQKPLERGVTAEQDREANRQDALMKKYNFNMEYVQTPFGTDAVGQLYASIMAGSPEADIAWTEIGWVMPMIANNLLHAWDELKYIDPNSTKWDATSSSAGSLGGRVYASRPSPVGMGNGNVLFWNKDMVSNASLQSVYELIKNKQWTWDKYAEYCKATTLDKDNDGNIDQYGVSFEQEFVMYLIHSNDGAFAKFDGTGRPLYALAEVNAMEAHQFANELKMKHKVAMPSANNVSWDYYLVAFKDGISMSTSGGIYWANDPGYFGELDFMGLAPMPMGPKASNYCSVTMQINLTGIVKGIDNPDEVAFVFDKWTDKDPEADPDAWKASYEAHVRDDDSMNIIVNFVMGNYPIQADFVYSFGSAFGPWYGFWPKVVNGEITIAQAIEENEKTGQDKLDETYNGWMSNMEK